MSTGTEATTQGSGEATRADPAPHAPSHPQRSVGSTLFRLARHAARSFHPSSLPPLCRRNFVYELRAAFFLPFLLVVVDSTIVGVIVKNAYAGVVSDWVLNLAVAILAASTSAANIVSFFWVRASNGLDKIKFINALQLGMIGLIVAIAFVPRTQAGLWTMVAAVLAARLCWAGFITIRSTIWGMNYGPHVRARVTGKLATIQVTMVALLGIGLGEGLNRHPEADRWFYPVGGALALLGVWAWSGIRVRGHRSLLSAERARTGAQAPTFSPVGVLRVLKADPAYARFMLCMFLLGLGNLMLVPILVIAVRDQFKMGYLGGILVNNSLPYIMMPFMIPVWARLLDRVHVIQFRAVHSWAFVIAAWVTWIAVAMHSAPLLYVSAIFMGLGFAGGVLAWNLGHLDFAPKGMESQYMGVHATLNGVRGIMAPFLAVGMYEGLERTHAGWGSWAFFVTAVLTAIGGLGFVMMARGVPRGGWRRQQPVETTPPAKATGD